MLVGDRHALVGNEEVAQMKAAEAPEDRGMIVAPLKSCVIMVGGKTRKAGRLISLTLLVSLAA